MIATSAYSQKEIAWFDTGIKVMYGGSGLVNNAIVDHPDLNYELAFGNSYAIGGKFGVNRGYNGLAVEVLYSQSGQTLENLASELVPESKWKSVDLYLLFRNAKNLGFFEIGPKVGFLQGFERTDANGQLTEFDNYASRYISGVLSFGVNVLGTDGAFSGQIGLRFEYGFTDLNGEDVGTTEPFPFEPNLYANGYEKSIPVYAGLVFELNWGLGYYGIAQCGARAKFFNM